MFRVRYLGLILPLLVTACGGGNGNELQPYLQSTPTPEADTVASDTDAINSATDTSAANPNVLAYPSNTNLGDSVRRTVKTDNYAPLNIDQNIHLLRILDVFESTENYISLNHNQPSLATAQYAQAYARLEQKYAVGIRPGHGVRIAIIDTLANVNVFNDPHWEFIGADIDAEALPGNYDDLICASFPCITPQNWRSHGTEVSSIIVAQRDNTAVPAGAESFDFHGVAWGATVRVFGVELGDPPDREWIYQPVSVGTLRRADPSFRNELRYVISSSQPDIVNMSFGWPGLIEHYTESEVTSNLPTTIDFISRQPGTVFVMSAGNLNERRCDSSTTNCINGAFAATSPSVMAGIPVYAPEVRDNYVAAVAVDNDGAIAWFSNRCGIAAAWCLAAPGSGLLTATTYWDEDEEGFYSGYTPFSGTSAAAPFVSGSLAFVKHYFGNSMSMPEVLNRLYVTAQVTPDQVPVGTQCPTHLDLDGDRTDCELSSETGRGVVDLDAATRPVGGISIGSDTVAGTLNSYVQLPPAYGDAATRLADIDLVGFDSLNAPFHWPAGLFIQSLDTPDNTIPRMDASGSPKAEDLVAYSLGLHEQSLTPERGWKMYLHDQQLGMRYQSPYALSFGAMTDLNANLGGQAKGIFGRQVRSGLLWSQWTTETQFGRDWRGWGSLSAGVGKPEYSNSVLEFSSSLFTAWELGLGNDRWQFSLLQPWRAENGTGVLRYSSGRLPSGERLYSQESFSLEPIGRELMLRTRYTAPLGGGRVAVQLSAHSDSGHVDNAFETKAGIAWRMSW